MTSTPSEPSDPRRLDRGGENDVRPPLTQRETAVEAAVESALASLDLAAKVRLLTGSNFWALYPAPRAGLRSIVVSDGPQGVKGGRDDMTETTTGLPSPTAMAASWDESLVTELGALLAGEARRKNVDVLLGPTINLHRSPLGGRHFEQFSEDPLLTGRIAVAYVRGLQSRGVGACPKHYVCNDSETDRHNYSAEIAERPLHEVYLAPFERAVREAGAWTVMAAYNRVNGIRMTEHPLLTDPLKARWGWDGLVMSDWYATHATIPSARAGLDLVMPGPTGPWGDSLLAAIRGGEVDEATVDEKVRRLLRLAARVGALAGVAPPAPAARPLPRAGIAALVRRAAAAGSVLLRNGGLLPLRPAELRRIALLGPNAAMPPAQGGGSANLRPDYAVTPLDGLRDALGPGVEILTNPSDAARPGMHPVAPSEVAQPSAAGDGPRAGTGPRPGAADTGSPGIVVRILDGAGNELGREVRTDGELSWVGKPELEGRPVVELTTRLRSPLSGPHRIGFAARGHVTMWLDGRQVVDASVMPELADIDSIWHNAPIHAVDVDLGPDRSVELRVRWEKFYDRSAVFLRLLLEKPLPADDDWLAAEVELARAADVALVCVGTTKDDETEGRDRASLELQPRQNELIRRVAAANPRTVVVLAAGSPVVMAWRDEVAAILLTWFPGQEAGNALADVLLGRVEPGGRLPTTWGARAADVPIVDTQPHDGAVRYDEGIHLGHRAWLRAAREPAFWFGHGLGYTSWEYLEAAPASEAGEPAVRVRLRNAGSRPGREVVQAYLARPDSALERPVRWLGGFAAATAEPGETVEVLVLIDRWALRHWDVDAAGGSGDWALERGRFEVAIGRSAGDLRLWTAIDADA